MERGFLLSCFLLLLLSSCLPGAGPVNKRSARGGTPESNTELYSFNISRQESLEEEQTFREEWDKCNAARWAAWKQSRKGAIAELDMDSIKVSDPQAYEILKAEVNEAHRDNDRLATPRVGLDILRKIEKKYGLWLKDARWWTLYDKGIFLFRSHDKTDPEIVELRKIESLVNKADWAYYNAIEYAAKWRYGSDYDRGQIPLYDRRRVYGGSPEQFDQHIEDFLGNRDTGERSVPSSCQDPSIYALTYSPAQVFSKVYQEQRRSQPAPPPAPAPKPKPAPQPRLQSPPPPQPAPQRQQQPAPVPVPPVPQPSPGGMSEGLKRWYEERNSRTRDPEQERMAREHAEEKALLKNLANPAWTAEWKKREKARSSAWDATKQGLLRRAALSYSQMRREDRSAWDLMTQERRNRGKSETSTSEIARVEQKYGVWLDASRLLIMQNDGIDPAGSHADAVEYRRIRGLMQNAENTYQSALQNARQWRDDHNNHDASAIKNKVDSDTASSLIYTNPMHYDMIENAVNPSFQFVECGGRRMQLKYCP